MNQLRSRVRLRHLALGLALCAVAWAGAACAPTTVAPAATSAPTSAPLATTTAPVRSELPVGMDSDGNFYRGDPKAPVKLIEFSDFQ